MWQVQYAHPRVCAVSASVATVARGPCTNSNTEALMPPLVNRDGASKSHPICLWPSADAVAVPPALWWVEMPKASRMLSVLRAATTCHLVIGSAREPPHRAFSRTNACGSDSNIGRPPPECRARDPTVCVSCGRPCGRPCPIHEDEDKSRFGVSRAGKSWSVHSGTALSGVHPTLVSFKRCRPCTCIDVSALATWCVGGPTRCTSFLERAQWGACYLA
ncbi:hypothetical protein C8Q73DRAFT_703567 [Cubamyces lactineus]|nr:hypothetical protein C8Q73DRAFT_703567 [Cubamyces lactineus]